MASAACRWSIGGPSCPSAHSGMPDPTRVCCGLKAGSVRMGITLTRGNLCGESSCGWDRCSVQEQVSPAQHFTMATPRRRTTEISHGPACQAAPIVVVGGGSSECDRLRARGHRRVHRWRGPCPWRAAPRRVYMYTVDSYTKVVSTKVHSRSLSSIHILYNQALVGGLSDTCSSVF